MLLRSVDLSCCIVKMLYFGGENKSTMQKKKVSGQRRKLDSLIKNIDAIECNYSFTEKSESYYVPCGRWLSMPKTSGKVKTRFCDKRLEKTEYLIKNKPVDKGFCKIVASIAIPDFWASQIEIFYDEEYYNQFFYRKGPLQAWTQIDNYSFVKERNIKCGLTEKGYTLYIEDEDETLKNEVWFYGDM